MRLETLVVSDGGGTELAAGLSQVAALLGQARLLQQAGEVLDGGTLPIHTHPHPADAKLADKKNMTKEVRDVATAQEADVS